MTTYTYENEKQVLKFYIRLLLYVNDKYSENESSKISANSYLDYLKNLALKNKLLHDGDKEMLNGPMSLDESYSISIAKKRLGQGIEQIQELIPPFTQLSDELTNEEMDVLSIINSHLAFTQVYTKLMTLPIESQLYFIRHQALPIFSSNGWKKETDYKPENVETILGLLLLPIHGDAASMKVRKPGLKKVRIMSQDEEKLALKPAIRPEVRQELRQELRPAIKIKTAQGLETELETEQFIPPFTQSSSVSGKEVLLHGIRKELVNTIRTNTNLQKVYDLLAKQSTDVQLKFIEIVAPEFLDNKWDVQTTFTDADVKYLYTFITRALKEIEFRSPFTKSSSTLGKELELNEKEINVVTAIKTNPKLSIVYDFLSELSLEFQLKFIKKAAETFTTKNWTSKTHYIKANVETILQIITNLAVSEENKKLEARVALILTSGLTPDTPAEEAAQAEAAQSAPAQSAPAQSAQAEAALEQVPQINKQQIERQTATNTLMAGKSPMEKLKNILGPKIMNELNKSTATQMEVIYSKKFIEFAIKSLEAFIAEFKEKILSRTLIESIGKAYIYSVTEFAKLTAPDFVRRNALRVTLISLYRNNLIENINSLYDYPQGIDDFINELQIILDDMKRKKNTI